MKDLQETPFTSDSHDFNVLWLIMKGAPHHVPGPHIKTVTNGSKPKAFPVSINTIPSIQEKGLILEVSGMPKDC